MTDNYIYQQSPPIHSIQSTMISNIPANCVNYDPNNQFNHQSFLVGTQNYQIHSKPLIDAPLIDVPVVTQTHAHVSQELNSKKLKDFFTKYEISPYIQEDIDEVRKYDIFMIIDDSGSMKEPSSYLSFLTNDFIRKTRWDEAHETVDIVAELGVLLDDDGIDVRTLNRDEMYNIRSTEQVASLFNKVPQGRTPLTKVLHEVINMPSKKPKLILIVTDGEPNDDDGYSDCDNFYHLLKNRDADKNRIAILACTTSETQMKWLNKIDKIAKHVDVIDDYISERKDIIAVQGKDFPYSHGDHIIKMLLGPILQKYDDLDEKKFIRSSASAQNSSHQNPIVYVDRPIAKCECTVL